MSHKGKGFDDSILLCGLYRITLPKGGVGLAGRLNERVSIVIYPNRSKTDPDDKRAFDYYAFLRQRVETPKSRRLAVAEERGGLSTGLAPPPPANDEGPSSSAGSPAGDDPGPSSEPE